MSVFKSTVWYTVGNLFSRSIGFILLPFYSNLISTVDFADYSLIMSAYLVVSAIYRAGLHYSLTKHYLEAKEDQLRKHIFSTLFSLILIWSLVLSAVFSFNADNISNILLGSFDKSNLIIISIWMLFADTFFYTAIHLLKVLELSEKVAIYTAIYSIINLLLNVVLVFILKLGITGILTAQISSAVVLSFIIIPVIKQYYKPVLDFSILPGMLLFSLPLLLSDLFSTMVDVIDRFILNHFMDKTAVGLYSFSYRVAMIMNVFVISFRTAWTPYSLRLYNERKEYPVIFGKSLTKFVALSLLVFLTVSSLIDDAFKFSFLGLNIFSAIYEPGIIIIPFILLGYAFGGMASFYAVYPYASGKSFHFLISEAVGFIVNFLLNIILVPRFGIIGAAVSTTLSLLAVLIYLVALSREVKISYQYKELFLITSTALAFFGLSKIINLLSADVLLIVLFILFLRKVLNVRLSLR